MKRVTLDLQKIIERLTNPHHSLKGPDYRRRVLSLSSLFVLFILDGITAIILIIFRYGPIFNILIGFAIAFLVGIICTLAIVVALIQYQKFQHIRQQPRELSEDFLELQRERETLKQSEVCYHDLFSRLPAALYLTSMEGKILDANPALVGLLGYPDRETLPNINAKEIYMDPKDRVEENTLAMNEGVGQGFRVQLRRFDGCRIWVRDKFCSIKDAQGNVFYEGGLEDITEQVQAEEMNDKSASRNQIKHAFDAESLGVVR